MIEMSTVENQAAVIILPQHLPQRRGPAYARAQMKVGTIRVSIFAA